MMNDHQQVDLTALPVAPSLHWVEAWATWLKFEDTKRGGGRLSENSLEAYLTSVKHFARWFETVRPASAVLGMPFSLSHFNTDVVYEYFRWQEEGRVPAKSWNLRLTSLRKVAKWGLRMGYLQDDPTRVIGRIHKIESAPKRIEDEQFEKLEGVAASGSYLKRKTELWSKLWMRDQVIWCLLNLGLRVGEIPNVDLRDLDLENGRLRVLGKGHVEGSVILTSEAVSTIGNWLALRSTFRFASTEPKLITDWNGRAISDGQVRRRYKQMCAEVGLKSTTHDMRNTTIHRMIAHFLANGWSLESAVRAAGDQARHRDMRTTWSYLRVPEGQVRAALEAR